MTFRDTRHINLIILLNSKEKAKELIQRFIDEHNKDTSSFDGPIKALMRSSAFSQRFIGLTQLYQRLIIPQLEKKLNDEAWEETKQKWQRQGKSPFVKKTLFNGKVINDTLNTFDAEVKEVFEQKKRIEGGEYERRTQEQTRISSADGILKGAKLESEIPNGFGMGNGGNGDTPDENSPPPPRDNGSNSPKKCDICKETKNSQEKLFRSRSGKAYCVKCYRQYFTENVLKNLRGWKELSDKTQQHYLSQIDKCQTGANFKTLKQVVLDTISEIAFTCSECNKNSSGKRWGVKGVEDKLFCSQNCAKTWQQKNQEGSEEEEVNSNDNEEGGMGNKGEENNFDDNSEPNSDHGSHNIPTQKGGNNNELPPDIIQEITNLPLPQAKEKAEQEIEKFLKDNSISEAELDKEDWSEESNWKSHLRNLDTSQKVAEFTQKMHQAILRKALNKQNLTSNQNNQKKPENDWTVLIIIFSLSLLALITLIIIIRKRRQKGF